MRIMSRVPEAYLVYFVPYNYASLLVKYNQYVILNKL